MMTSVGVVMGVEVSRRDEWCVMMRVKISDNEKSPVQSDAE